VPRRSRRGALVALVTVLALAVLGTVGTILTTWLQTRPLGEVTGPTSATSRQVRTGHCIEDLPDDGVVGRVTVVPCSAEHEAEVLGELHLGSGEWPGEDEVRERAEAWCEMGSDEVEAGLRPVVWTPSERSWGQGDHTALCLGWNGD